jgi:hypothetical protein
MRPKDLMWDKVRFETSEIEVLRRACGIEQQWRAGSSSVE